MNQLFQIGAEAWGAMDHVEIAATAAAMKEFGIYQLPYDKVDLRLPLDVAAHTSEWYEHTTPEAFQKHIEAGRLRHDPTPDNPERYVFNFGPCAFLDVVNLSLGSMEYATRITVVKGSPVLAPKQYDQRSKAFNSETERDLYANALIVMLATRNAVKSTVHHKSVRLGIGKNKGKYEYVTTITLPREQDMEDDAEHTPGAARCPHLRRGHIRNQHYGPKNSYIKQKWIEPVFVNADAGWCATRKAYNVSI